MKTLPCYNEYVFLETRNLKHLEDTMKHRILAINPGSTSTKIAIYSEQELEYKKSIKHNTETITSYNTIYDQLEFRLQAVLDTLDGASIDINTFDAVVGRGGMLKPIEGGTYLVNDAMVAYVKEAPRGEHASNLGCVIAKKLRTRSMYHLTLLIQLQSMKWMILLDILVCLKLKGNHYSMR